MVIAEMHCMNTLPIWYSTRDLNMGPNGITWPLYNFYQTWKTAPNFDAFQPGSVKQDLGYEKEVLKQIMLKQDAIFVDQVSELHRLYRRQKELMDDTTRRQLLQYQMQPQHYSSQLEPELSEKSVLSTTNFEPPSSSKWSQQLSPERKKPAKRMLDLELPADVYIDSEEGEQFEDEKVSEVREVPCHSTKSISESPSPNNSSLLPFTGGLHAAYNGGFHRTNSLPRKDFELVDLNGPIQVEDEETFPNNLDLMSNVERKVQCPTFSLSVAKNQEPSECTNLALESSQRSCNVQLQNNLRSVSSCVRTSQQIVPPSYVAKLEPSSVTSLRKTCGNLRHIPMAVQALPCFKSPPSVGIQGTRPDKYNSYGNFASTPSVEGISSLQNNLFFKSHLESMYLKPTGFEANKDTDRVESGTSIFDLKRLGYSACQKYDNVSGNKPCIPSRQISPPASNSHPNWFEEIRNSEKVGNLGNGSDRLVTSKGEYNKSSCFGTLIDLNSCIPDDEMTMECSIPSTVTKTKIEVDLEGPVSPENKEGSPPRGESEEHPLEPSVQLSKQEDRDPHEELVRAAAEAIVTISSSEQLHADTDCLLWFAGIISSVSSNLENDPDLLPQGMDDFEDWRLKCKQREVEAHSCNGNGLKVKREGALSLPSHQRKERTRRVRQRKDFRTSSLPCLAEEGLIEPTGFAAETDSKRSAGKNRCSKGRRRAISSSSPSTVVESRKLQANEEAACLMDLCRGGWGKVNRRRRGRRVAASNPYLVFQL